MHAILHEIQPGANPNPLALIGHQAAPRIRGRLPARRDHSTFFISQPIFRFARRRCARLRDKCGLRQKLAAAVGRDSACPLTISTFPGRAAEPRPISAATRYMTFIMSSRPHRCNAPARTLLPLLGRLRRQSNCQSSKGVPRTIPVMVCAI